MFFYFFSNLFDKISKINIFEYMKVIFTSLLVLLLLPISGGF